MKTAKATLSNFRQAPRKMRMVANAVRGKKVSEALTNLDFMAKKASLPIKNLIQSAIANAKFLDIPMENLIVKNIKVDSGSILYRRMPAARGTAHPIRKRTSRVSVELGELVASSKKLASRSISKKAEKVEKVSKKSVKNKATKNLATSN